jgi:pimeloyl-ACP methyl ester carboxylesterase
MSRTSSLINLGAIAVGAAGIWAGFVHDMARARGRLTGRSERAETSFGTLEYAVVGQGEPMLIVHGAGGGFYQGIDMTGALAGHGYQLIAPSRFGYLRSSMPANLTTAMQADAYAQLLDHLGIDKVVVVGISAGAWSSLQFAIRHPEGLRALILLVPANYLPAGMSMRGGVAARAILKSDFLAWAAVKLGPVTPGGMTRMMLGTEPAVVRAAASSEKARVRQVIEHLLPVSARTEGMQFDVKTAATHEPYAIALIACPVLTISAEDDIFGTATRAKTIAAGVPNGKAIIFPSGGHALVGHYDDTLSQSTAFLQAIRP